ncbi:MAG: helix-turn-helix domain-containing protein [Verrucomicrobiota bacterium]
MLGIPGILFATLPHLEAERNYLAAVEAGNPQLSFGQLLRKLRERAGLTVPDLIRRMGGDQKKLRDLFYAWEVVRGRKPSPTRHKLVAQLDQVLDAKGALLRCFNAPSLNDPDDLGDRMRRAAAEPYKLWTDTLEAGFRHLVWFKTKDVHDGKIRRSAKHRWNAETVKFHRADYGYFFGWLVRFSGLGFTEQSVSLPLLADADLVRMYIKWHKTRAGAYNNWSRTFAGNICSLVRAETGYFWQFPSVLLTMPELDEASPDGLAPSRPDEATSGCYCPYIEKRLPTEERLRRGRTETKPLSAMADRCVVFCEQSDADLQLFLQSLVGLGRSDSRQTRPADRRVKSILAMDNPVDVIIVCSQRMENARPPKAKEVQRALHIRNELLVALLGVYPFRELTVTRLLLNEHLIEDEEGWRLAIEGELFKNHRPGLAAEFGWFGRLHKLIAKLLELYLKEARPVLLKHAKTVDKHLFLSSPNFGRSSKGLQSIFEICVRVTRKYVPDLAPHGINPHAFRKIVATHWENKADPKERENSATALKDSPNTVSEYYVVRNEIRKNDGYTRAAEQEYEKRSAALRRQQNPGG